MQKESLIVTLSAGVLIAVGIYTFVYLLSRVQKPYKTLAYKQAEYIIEHHGLWSHQTP